MAYDDALYMLLDLPKSEKDSKALHFIQETTRNAKLVQEKVLADILDINKDVEYLKRFKLDGANDSATFKSKIPIVTYEDIESDIQRIADGDLSAILSARPLSEFCISSGTSGGQSKMIPMTREELERSQLLRSLHGSILNLHMPGFDKCKALRICHVKFETKTPSGLLAQPVSTSLYKTERFKASVTNSNVYTSPIEYILCRDSFQSMYTQMLCGLLESHEVVRIVAPYATGIVHIIKFLESNWRELASDIMSGTLNVRITDPTVKNCIAKILKPNPELGEFIRSECSKQNWDGIIRRIWPNVKFLETVITGSMAQYISILDRYSGNLPYLSNTYSSTESFFGMNMNPMCKPSEVSYTIMPYVAYFEFLPHETDSSDSKNHSYGQLIDLVDVEVGKEYEIVATTYTGLYRYKVGDILRVTGFYNSAPQFQFVGRKSAMLSIDGETTSEAELHKAVENASQILHEFNTSVIEYTSYADTKTFPGHYVIYWDLLSEDPTNLPSNELLNKCCLAIEESLSIVYRAFRVKLKSIGPLEIRVVKSGTFEELMVQAVSRGASITQYKTPRYVKLAPALELLDSRVISTHFSPSFPHWSLK